MSPRGIRARSLRIDRPQTLTLDRFFKFSLCALSVLCPDCHDFALCPYNTHNTFMPSEGFEPATPGSCRPQTLALEVLDTGIGCSLSWLGKTMCVCAELA
jgi:hypothetical protein